jgi:hypothetical protein
MNGERRVGFRIDYAKLFNTSLRNLVVALI